MCAPIAALGLTTGLQTFVAGTALAATAMSAYGTYQQGQQQKAMGEYNARANENAAKDALKRGEQDAQQIRMQAERLKSTQRVRMASAGLDLTEGSAADILDSTDFFSESDQETARYNARKDAVSARNAGGLSIYQGNAAANSASLGAFGTVLGGASQVAGKWYSTSGK